MVDLTSDASHWDYHTDECDATKARIDGMQNWPSACNCKGRQGSSKPLAQRLKERAAIRRMEDRLDDAELFDEAALALATTPETLQPASNERLSDTNLRNIRSWAENHLEFSSDDSGPRMIAEAMDELLMRRRAAETGPVSAKQVERTREFYLGYLSDELHAHAPHLFDLMRRKDPQAIADILNETTALKASEPRVSYNSNGDAYLVDPPAASEGDQRG